jgi:two-component system alkaline phosphatase synthesis response regulator PhoP
MYRVALVEDEALIRAMIRLNLEKSGYQVECFDEGRRFLERLEETAFDLILLDIMLPGLSGDEILTRIRKQGVSTPVLMVTAKSDVSTKVSTLLQGADDYLAKPFDVEELLARVIVLIRRSQGERSLPSSRVIRIGRYEVNLESRVAQTRQGEVLLTERECDLLALFARNAGKVLNRADILEEAWGMDVDPTPRTVDNFILRFRKLFEEDPENPRSFLTVRASGYLFEP